MRQLALARSALRLSNQDFPDLSLDAQAGTLPIQSITIILLSQLVQGVVTVSHELSGVTQAVATISEENENLREELHDMSSKLANLPTPKKNKPPPGSPISKHPFVTCHIVCQPGPLPPWLRPPPHRGCPIPPQLPAPPRGKERRRPEHLPHLLQVQPRLTTLNTSYHSTIRGLARRSVSPTSTPSSIPTHTRPGSSGKGGTTLTPSPQATYTPTPIPSPPMGKLPPAQARAARAKAELGSLVPPNKL